MSLVGEYFFSVVNNHIHVYLFPVFSIESQVTREDIMGNDRAKSSNDEGHKTQSLPKAPRIKFPLVTGDCNTYILTGLYSAVLSYLLSPSSKMATTTQEICNSTSISTSELCKNCHNLAQVSKYPNGYQWAALSFISTLHMKK